MSDIEPSEQSLSVEFSLPQEQISPSEIRQIRLDVLEQELKELFNVAGEVIPVAKDKILELVQRAKDGDDSAMVDLNKGPLRALMLLTAQKQKMLRDWEKAKLDPVLTPAEKTNLANLKYGMPPDTIVDVLERLDDGELGNRQALALYKEIMVAQGNEGSIEPVGQLGATRIDEKLEQVRRTAEIKPPDQAVRPLPSARLMMPPLEEVQNDEG